MAYQLVILKAAAEDTADAYEYYEKIQQVWVTVFWQKYWKDIVR